MALARREAILRRNLAKRCAGTALATVERMHSMVKSSVSALAVALALVAGTGRADADAIVYEHVPGGGGGWASFDAGDVGSVWRTFDQFTLAGPHVLSAVQWRGAYVDVTGGTSTLPDSTAFTFRFYADNGGVPAAAPLYQQSVAFGAISTTFLGNLTIGGFQARAYDFAAALPVGFSASAGTPYWLSIASVEPLALPGYFAWLGGTGGNGTTYQLANLATPFTRSGDRAFALAAVPEPVSLSLLSTGLAAAMFARRRRAR
jgi:hypothetical protein